MTNSDGGREVVGMKWINFNPVPEGLEHEDWLYLGDCPDGVNYQTAAIVKVPDDRRPRGFRGGVLPFDNCPKRGLSISDEELDECMVAAAEPFTDPSIEQEQVIFAEYGDGKLFMLSVYDVPEAQSAIVVRTHTYKRDDHGRLALESDSGLKWTQLRSDLVK